MTTSKHLDFRVLALIGITAGSTWAVFTTEVLSFFHALYFLPVLIAWLVFCAITVSVCRLKISGIANPFTPSLSFSEIIQAIFIASTMIASLVIVIISMSNSWDAMTYHLPRVMHWMQNHTVDFYPTHNIRQLTLAPGASYLVMQWGLLTGNLDKAGIVQWMAMMGSVLGISLIVKDLGFNRRVQLMAALIALTIPMGILQSVSTQNHYVSALWLIIFIRFWMVYVYSPRRGDGLVAGLALGLGILSKEVNWIFMAPFLLWGLVEIFRRHRDKFLITLFGFIIIFGLLNGGYLYRTISQTHEWKPVASVINAQFNVESFLVNVLRNVALNMDVPYVSQWATDALYTLSHWLGINLNYPGASYSSEPFQVLVIPFDEDYAGSFGHVLASIVAIGGLFLLAPPLRKKIVTYGVLGIMAFLLFCLIVRFQPWHMRFQLSLWLLASPLIAIGLYHINGIIRWIVIGVLIVMAAMTMVFNNQHPWTGGRSIFQNPPEVQMYYKKGLNEFVADKAISQAVFMSRCRDVGVIMGGDSWQYPLWRQIQTTVGPIHLESVTMFNESRQLAYPLGAFNPCLIITEYADAPDVRVNDTPYAKVWQTTHQPIKAILVP